MEGKGEWGNLTLLAQLIVGFFSASDLALSVCIDRQIPALALVNSELNPKKRQNMAPYKVNETEKRLIVLSGVGEVLHICRCHY